MRSNRSIPASTVVPVLVYPDVRAAVAWRQEAFGFAERVRVGEDHRAQLAVGDGAVIVADVGGARTPPAVDPWGHRWTFSETLDDVAPEDWGGIAVTG
jgi:hypothetical protein